MRSPTVSGSVSCWWSRRKGHRVDTPRTAPPPAGGDRPPGRVTQSNVVKPAPKAPDRVTSRRASVTLLGEAARAGRFAARGRSRERRRQSRRRRSLFPPAQVSQPRGTPPGAFGDAAAFHAIPAGVLCSERGTVGPTGPGADVVKAATSPNAAPVSMEWRWRRLFFSHRRCGGDDNVCGRERTIGKNFLSPDSFCFILFYFILFLESSPRKLCVHESMVYDTYF